MKTFPQVLLCAAWILAVFYYMGRPPKTPEPFASADNMAPSREVYNPALGSALDPKLRDYWQKPYQVLERLGDLTGLKVADIGSGEGYFTLKLLDRVGPTGKVYANDIQKEMLDVLESRIPDAYRDRIALILGSETETGIPEPVDLILLIQVFGEVPNQKTFLRQLKRIMHENSRLVIIDSKHITDPHNGFTRPLDLLRLTRELNGEGLVFPADFDPLDFDFLPKQFFFILELER